MKIIDSNTFIIADTHFGHDNISQHEPIRKMKAYENGFSNVDELMIHNWNQIITKDDTVFHLGDFAFKHKDLYNLSNQLNGNKILLIGNHDKSKDIEILQENGWKIIDTLEFDIDERQSKRLIQHLNNVYKIQLHQNKLLCCYVTDIENKRIMFTHFPLFNDNPYDEKYNQITEVLEYIYKELDCELNIHGHTHSHGAKKDFCISACVELIDFKPIKLSALL